MYTASSVPLLRQPLTCLVSRALANHAHRSFSAAEVATVKIAIRALAVLNASVLCVAGRWAAAPVRRKEFNVAHSWCNDER